MYVVSMHMMGYEDKIELALSDLLRFGSRNGLISYTTGK